MARRNLLPGTLPGFDIYIRRAIPYLLAEETVGNPRWKRLGMKQDEMDMASDFHHQWWTGNPAAPGVFELHSNEATKTKATRKSVAKIMLKFTPFFSKLLRRMSTYDYTATDKVTLLIPERKNTYTRRGKIQEIPQGSVLAKGGCRLQIRVYNGGQEGRPTMHPKADCIELRYFIGANPPENPGEMTMHVFSTAALFTFLTESNAEGNIFTGYVRYLNTSKPENNSSWGNIMQKRIH